MFGKGKKEKDLNSHNEVPATVDAAVEKADEVPKEKKPFKEKVKNFFRSYIIDGLILVVLGVLMLLWENTLQYVCIAIGVVLSVNVLITLIKIGIGFMKNNEDRVAGDILTAVFELAVGIALLVKGELFVQSFYLIVGALLAFGAVLMLIHAFITRKERNQLFIITLIFAVITAALAVIVFINPTDAWNVEVVKKIQGVSLIVEGLAMLVVLNNIGSVVKEKEKVPAGNERPVGSDENE
ncbi:MAG: DUF308 domain-containing protein [Clostridia bacterium]|nr:DUF308 domain-containing protein [Clostridia bacterium]